MTLKKRARNVLRTILIISASGMTLAVNCTDQQFQVIAVGLNAIAGAFTNESQQSNNDLTFGEWLLSELDDL